MADPAEDFFQHLVERGRVPLLQGVSGILLLEVRDGDAIDRWFVHIDRGRLGVQKQGDEADCVVRTDRDTLNAIIRGDVNAMAAVLRGRVEIDGKVSLLVALQSLFKPSAGAEEQPSAGYARRPS